MEIFVNLNNRLVVETYKGSTGLQTEHRGGLSMVSQKVKLVPLKLVIDSYIEGRRYSKGALVYFREEKLMKMPWATKILTAEGIDGEFIVVEAVEAEFIQGSFFKILGEDLEVTGK